MERNLTRDGEGGGNSAATPEIIGLRAVHQNTS